MNHVEHGSVRAAGRFLLMRIKLAKMSPP